jgi:hypothetical protein
MSELDSVEKTEVLYHVFKHGFMPNYVVWREHGEVETTIESDRDQDVDRMDDMVDDITISVQHTAFSTATHHHASDVWTVIGPLT